MILTTKGRYAVMAVIEIADEQDEKPVSLLTISKNQNISLSYLEQIFAKLRKAGIVSSIKGPGGGYVLGKNQHEITIAEIIKAIGEPIKMTRCKEGEKSCIAINKKLSSKCKSHHIWLGLEKEIYKYLNSLSLRQICTKQ